MSDEAKRIWDSERASLSSKQILQGTEPWQRDGLPSLSLIGGVDISFIKGDDVNACAGYVVCSLSESGAVDVVYSDARMVRLTAPYVPGYLAFREAEPLVQLINSQRESRPGLTPQVILVDGNGILHPSRFGLACHIGVLADLPTVGVAKNLFQMEDLGLKRDGGHKQQIEELHSRGDSFDLRTDSNEVLGVALRSSEDATKPVFVSVGHRMDLKTATAVVLACSKYRIPEPTRQADMRTREYLRKLT